MFYACGTIKGMKTYGERLGWALERAGKSGAELARELGVTKSAVYQVTGGQSATLTAINSARAAKLLNVDHHWLATGEGAPSPRNLSPMAIDIAKQFDSVATGRQDALYAALTYVVQLAIETAPAEERLAPLPSVEPPQRT